MTASRARRVAIACCVTLPALCVACAPGAGGPLGAGAVSTADPDALLGLASREIGAALGRPELQRQEPPAEVWQYRTASCVFDLYLYDEDGALRAAHYEVRSRTNGAVDPAQCLGSVVERYRIASAEEPAPADPERL